MEHNNDTFSESFDLSTGFHDHTAKIKISPWPFIATGTLATISVTLTPGKLITELKRIITWFRHDACSDWSEIYCTFTCKLIENETSFLLFKWRHTRRILRISSFKDLWFGENQEDTWTSKTTTNVSLF